MRKILIKIVLWCFRTAAKIQLKKINPKIIAFTGSVGKTSLRNALFAVLKDHFKVKKSVKANSETGIPLDILGLHLKDYSVFDWFRVCVLVPLKLVFNWQKYDFYLVELGIDDPYPPKNMSYLLSFIQPKMAIFLNVAPVHTQQFEKVIPKGKAFSSWQEREEFLKKAIALEKGKIITTLVSDKIAIVNKDDPLVMEQGLKCRAQLYTFGKGSLINKFQISNKQINDKFQISKWLRIINYQVSNQGTVFEYQWQGKLFKLKLNYLLPQYYSYTFGAAILTGLKVGLSLDKISSSLVKDFKLPPGRMSVFKGIKQTTLIDSSYNASKIATLGALELLKKVGQGKKKVFVFGDMRELGNQEASEHQEVGQKIITSVNKLILIGPLTKAYVLPIAKDKIPVEWFKTSFKAVSFIKNQLLGGEIILIKGSQNTIFTEIVVEALLQNRKDVTKLCRRGKFWDKQRQAIQD